MVGFSYPSTANIVTKVSADAHVQRMARAQVLNRLTVLVYGDLRHVWLRAHKRPQRKKKGICILTLVDAWQVGEQNGHGKPKACG